MEKLHISYDDVHRFVGKMSSQIMRSEYEPEVMIAISAGGLIPARLFRNCLNIPIYVVCIKFYDEDEDVPESSEPDIKQWLDENALEFVRGKRILIVDEVSDTGATLRCCVDRLRETCDPESISIAVLHHKNKGGKIEFDDDVSYYVGDNIDDVWICYPWETTTFPRNRDAVPGKEDIQDEGRSGYNEDYDDASSEDSGFGAYVVGPERVPISHCNLS